MRIVGLQEFLSLPVGTIYHKTEPSHFSDFGVFEGRTTNYDDFYYTPIDSPNFSGTHSSSEWADEMDKLERYSSYSSSVLTYDVVSRDGLYEENQMFAVYEKADVEALIAKLNKALLSGYGS